MKDNNDFLLTSNQLAKACGISRATVLRLEERGLVKPTEYITGNSSRLYDISALYQTQALLMLQELGFTNQDIKDFIDNEANFNVLKFILNKKIKEAVKILDVISNYTDSSNHLSIGNSERSGFVAYAEEVKITKNWKENKDLFQTPLLNAIKRGYELDWDTPISLVAPDRYITDPDSDGSTAKVFIPINPVTVRLSESKNIIKISGDIDLPHKDLLISMETAHYTSITWHGPLDGFEISFEKLNEYLDDNDIETYPYTHIAFYHGDFYGDRIPKERNYVRVFKKHVSE